MPVNAVAPLRALLFCAIVRTQFVPSHDPIPTPSAIVVSGATLVSATVTPPAADTVNMWVIDPIWPSVSENDCVVVAGVGVVGVDVLDAPHGWSADVASITLSRSWHAPREHERRHAERRPTRHETNDDNVPQRPVIVEPWEIEGVEPMVEPPTHPVTRAVRGLS